VHPSTPLVLSWSPFNFFTPFPRSCSGVPVFFLPLLPTTECPTPTYQHVVLRHPSDPESQSSTPRFEVAAPSPASAAPLTAFSTVPGLQPPSTGVASWNPPPSPESPFFTRQVNRPLLHASTSKPTLRCLRARACILFFFTQKFFLVFL